MAAQLTLLKKRQTTDYESLSTDDVLRVYESVFAPLEPRGRRRILERARLHGWDRTFHDTYVRAA
ncbi:MAG: hypothetical protein WED01_11935 [Candidatus Rokuibacteriota bacterium]